MWNSKRGDKNELTYKTENKFMVARKWGRMGEGIVREFGKVVHTLIYFKWITKKDILYSTWNSAQCYLAVWMGGRFRGEWKHVYIWLNSFAVHLKISQYC